MAGGNSIKGSVNLGKKIKKIVRPVKKEWALISADPIKYFKDWVSSSLATLGFWYNRIRKAIITLTELALFSVITDRISNVATLFIESIIKIFFKYKDGQLAKTVEAAKDALAQKKIEIINQRDKSPEAIQKELAQWQSAIKEYPITLTYKLISGILDLIDNVMLFKKAFTKTIEINTRIKLLFVQNDFFKTYDFKQNIQLTRENVLYEDYRKAYEDVIKTARDPMLAQAFLEAYIVTLRRLMVPENKLKNIYARLQKTTGYNEKLKIIKNTQAIQIYDVNLKILQAKHKELRNDNNNEATLDTPFNRITNMVESKEKAKVFEHALAILNENPLFSDIKDNKKAQQGWFSNEWKIFYNRFLKEKQQVRREIGDLKQTSNLENEYQPIQKGNKKKLKFLEKKWEYINQKHEKTIRLCDLTQMNGIENSDAKFYKIVSLISAAILIINTLISLSSFVFAVVALATTGNVAPILNSTRSLLDLIKDFAGDKSISFVDMASGRFFGLIRTTKKSRNAYNIYVEKYKELEQELGWNMKEGITVLKKIEEQKTELIKAKEDYEEARQKYEVKTKQNDDKDVNPIKLSQKRKKLFKKQQQYYQSVGKNSQELSENKLLEKLKALRVDKKRFEQLRFKVLKKIILALGGVFMFGTVILTTFISTGPLAIILGVISFIWYPILCRFISFDGQKDIQNEAVKLGLLPKNTDVFKNKHLSLWLYVSFSFLLKFTVEGVIKFGLILPIMRFIHAIARKINPHGEGIKNAIKKVEENSFAFLIAQEMQNEVQSLNLVTEDGMIKRPILLFIYAPISFIFKLPQFVIKLIMIGLLKLFRCNSDVINSVDNIFSYSLFYAFCFLFKKLGDWLLEPKDLHEGPGIEILNEESYSNMRKHVFNNFYNLEMQFIQREDKIFYPQIIDIKDFNPQDLQGQNKAEEFVLEVDDSVLKGKIQLASLTTEYGENATNYYGFFNLEFKKPENEEKVEVYKVPFNKTVGHEININI